MARIVAQAQQDERAKQQRRAADASRAQTRSQHIGKRHGSMTDYEPQRQGRIGKSVRRRALHGMRRHVVDHAASRVDLSRGRIEGEVAGFVRMRCPEASMRWITWRMRRARQQTIEKDWNFRLCDHRRR